MWTVDAEKRAGMQYNSILFSVTYWFLSCCVDFFTASKGGNNNNSKKAPAKNTNSNNNNNNGKKNVVKAASNQKLGAKISAIKNNKPTGKPNNPNNKNNNNNGSVITTPSGIRLRKVNTNAPITKNNNNNNNNNKKVNNNNNNANKKSNEPKTTTPRANNGVSKLDSALQTARAIANNKGHFNHNEVKSLLESYEKGWVPKEKFLQLLPTLLFK